MRGVGLALLLVAAGCGGAPVTGVHVTVEFSGLMIDQIQFTIAPDGADPVVARRPDPVAAGAGWLSSPEDVMVYLPDRLAGRGVTCAALGMAGGAATPALGIASSTLVLHELVPARIAMQGPASSPPPPPPPSGGGDATMPCKDKKSGDGCN